MLTIRFSRQGKRKRPYYRLIISEKTKDTQGTYLELLGNFDPLTKKVALKTDRINYWLSQGAQTSNSVHNLLVNQGLLKSDKKKSVFLSKKRHSKIADQKKADSQPAAVATAAPAAAETPAPAAD